MDFFLRFAHGTVLIVALPLLMIVAWWRWYRYQGVRYRYPLANQLRSAGFGSTHPRTILLYTLRFFALVALVFLMAQPQLVDSRSKTTIEGIDIVLVLDVSDSMNLPHHQEDHRSRLDVAKQEAIRFIDTRVNDAIGIVIFGQDALSRCPLTADKNMLKQMVATISGDMVGPNGTLLSTAMLTAVNRLKHSTASSKVMIVLTDGEPTGNDIRDEIPLEAAKQLGIKIYTVGIGSDEELVLQHPVWGHVMVKTKLNAELLTKFADQTGGRFFEVKRADDMRTMYDTINMLEKTNIETPLFAQYTEFFMPLWIASCLLLCIELVVTTFIWFGL